MEENLDKLTASGLPIVDLNADYLERTDWSKTPLGPRKDWPASLTCLVNLITTFPHAAALWWGDDLCAIHNLAWAKATGHLNNQGQEARKCYSGEALSTIESSVRGRTVKVGCEIFLKDLTGYDKSSTVLLSTILDDNGKRQGVLAQLQHYPHVEKYLPLAQMDSTNHPQNRASQLKDLGVQQDGDRFTVQADHKQTELFQRFAELLPNGLAILDSDAEAVFVNDGFFKLTTNRTAKEFRAWPESIDTRDYEHVMSAYRSAFSQRKELRVEFRCTANGDAAEWRLFLLRPLSPDPKAGFICALVDITEIKNAELAQEKAAQEAQERKEQQERFIDMVSHEIRNPLSAVMHLAEEIKEISQDVSKRHSDMDKPIADIVDAANTILICVSHQNTLVDDILSFSKLDSMMLSLVPREVQPKWEFSKALKVFNSEFKAKHIKFHYAMDITYDEQRIDHVMADTNRMKQVLVNLVTNAIKFTARKRGERKIEVSMGASFQRPTSYPPNVVFFQSSEDAYSLDSTLSADWGNGSALYLMVAIKDTGIGISKEDQMKLFERFRQATPKTQERYGGSGLGLFISRKLVQLHGGDIGVSSKEGEGSTFAFFFRVRRADGGGPNGMPGFSRVLSRASSEGSNFSGLRSPRPSYSRANSQLNNIKERPKMGNHASQNEGVDFDWGGLESLANPPTERRAEHHAHDTSESMGDRYEESRDVAHSMDKEKKTSTVADSPQTAPQTEPQSQPNTAPDDSRRTLLLVEDNLINQKVLRRQLQSRGFEVITANNGQEAIDAVRARGQTSPDHPPNQKTYFDCILMDQEMPIKDGNAATKEIRDLQSTGQAGVGPILGVSANVREAQTQSMLAAGMDEVISKPFKVEELEKKIRGILPEDKR